jgi:hypothetical protein
MLLTLLVPSAYSSSYMPASLETLLAREPVVMEARVAAVACGNIAKGYPEPPPIRLGEPAATFITFEVLDGLKGVHAGDTVSYVVGGGCGSDWTEGERYDFSVGETWLVIAEPNSWGALRPWSPASVWRMRTGSSGAYAVSYEGMPMRTSPEDDPAQHPVTWAALEASLRVGLAQARALPSWQDPGFVGLSVQK